MAGKIDLSESLKKLNELVSWFESQKEVDIEQGLLKVKEGAELIKKSRARLREVENEFEEIERDLSVNKS